MISIIINQATGAVSYTIGTANGTGTSSTEITDVVFGHYKAGQENYAINPILKKISVSEEKQTVPTVGYTINYIFNSETIKTVEATSVVGGTVTAESPITINSTRYFAADGATTSMELTATASKNVLNVNLREPNIYNYSVVAKDGSGNTLTTFSTGSYTEGDAAIGVTYPRYVLSNSTLYCSGTGAISYSTTFTPDADGYEKVITYNTGTPIADVAFYTEGEDVAGATSGSNARASMGKMGFTTDENTYIDATTLSPGKYILYMRAQNGNSAARPFNFKVGDDVVFTGSFVQGTNSDLNSEEFTVSEASTLSFASVGSKASGIDYFYVVRIYTEVDRAILDVKALETSSEFATAVDAETFSTPAEVYAFYTTWEITNSDGVDYTKAIVNAGFELGTTNGWTIAGDPSSSASSDADKYGVVESNDNGGYQYYTGWNSRNVSQTIAGLPAGTYELTAQIYSWNGGAPVRLFANGTLSDAENGENHTVKLVFSVTGQEESIKIGVGGVGNNDDTDNTWGTWGYRVDYFTLTKLADVEVTIGAATWATLYTDYALDFSGVSGLKAYTAACDGQKVTLTEVDDVPAGTGVVLQGAAGSYNIPVIASSETAQGDLKGSTTEGKAYDANGTTDVYILVQNGKQVQFTKMTEGELAAGKAYLELVKSTGPGSRLNVVFEGETTGISTVAAAEQAADAVYSLSGQRVATPKKGLYIVNGKKMIIK